MPSEITNLNEYYEFVNESEASTKIEPSNDTRDVITNDVNNGDNTNNDNSNSTNNSTNNVHGQASKTKEKEPKKEEPEPKEEPTSLVLGEFTATMYTADCPGCSGITRYGYDVKDTIYAPNGLRVIAVDPSVIAPKTIVRVTFSDGNSFKAIAGDIGSAVNGREIDILVDSREYALNFGRQGVSLEVIQ